MNALGQPYAPPNTLNLDKKKFMILFMKDVKTRGPDSKTENNFRKTEGYLAGCLFLLGQGSISLDSSWHIKEGFHFLITSGNQKSLSKLEN